MTIEWRAAQSAARARSATHRDYHPSAILRAEGEQARLLRKSLIADLRLADRLAGESPRARTLGPDAPPPYSSRRRDYWIYRAGGAA